MLQSRVQELEASAYSSAMMQEEVERIKSTNSHVMKQQAEKINWLGSEVTSLQLCL